jgi:hypothetical protein
VSKFAEDEDSAIAQALDCTAFFDDEEEEHDDEDHDTSDDDC